MKNWMNEAVFYHIYTLGFCGAPNENNLQNEQRVSRIQKVEAWIPHLKSIGVSAVYFGPLFESGSHGYDTIDYYWIDRRLGSNADFKETVKKLHDAGIRVVLDGVFNHVGRDFWAFRDVIKNGSDSRYTGWFANLNFGGQSPYGDAFWYEGWEGHYNLVKLNLKNPEVIDHLLGAVAAWIDEFDIDGLRLDVAYSLDPEFMKTLRRFCQNKKEDFWLMGEIIHGDYKRIANEDMLHSVTNYEIYKGIYSSHNDKNYFEINYSLNRMFGHGGIYQGLTTYNFVDNHDVNRIASTLRNKAHLNNVFTLLFTIPGMPSIYYGSEWGIEGIKQNGSDAALRPALELEDIPDETCRLLEHIQQLAKIKKQLPALKYGIYEQVTVKNEQLVFKRTAADESVFIVLNLSDQESMLDFKMEGSLAVDLLTDEVYTINNNHISLQLSAYASMILVSKNK